MPGYYDNPVDREESPEETAQNLENNGAPRLGEGIEADGKKGTTESRTLLDDVTLEYYCVFEDGTAEELEWPADWDSGKVKMASQKTASVQEDALRIRDLLDSHGGTLDMDVVYLHLQEAEPMRQVEGYEEIRKALNYGNDQGWWDIEDVEGSDRERRLFRRGSRIQTVSRDLRIQPCGFDGCPSTVGIDPMDNLWNHQELDKYFEFEETHGYHEAIPQPDDIGFHLDDFFAKKASDISEYFPNRHPKSVGDDEIQWLRALNIPEDILLSLLRGGYSPQEIRQMVEDQRFPPDVTSRKKSHYERTFAGIDDFMPGDQPDDDEMERQQRERDDMDLNQMNEWWERDEKGAALKTADLEIEPDKYYAFYMGSVIGPYDSESEAWRDTGGDVEWIERGVDIISTRDALGDSSVFKPFPKTYDDELEGSRKQASMPRYCEIYLATDDKWYLLLAPNEYEEADRAEPYGPFSSESEAEGFLNSNFSNPGAIYRGGSGPPPENPSKRASRQKKAYSPSKGFTVEEVAEMIKRYWDLDEARDSWGVQLAIGIQDDDLFDRAWQYCIDKRMITGSKKQAEEYSPYAENYAYREGDEVEYRDGYTGENRTGIIRRVLKSDHETLYDIDSGGVLDSGVAEIAIYEKLASRKLADDEVDRALDQDEWRQVSRDHQLQQDDENLRNLQPGDEIEYRDANGDQLEATVQSPGVEGDKVWVTTEGAGYGVHQIPLSWLIVTSSKQAMFQLSVEGVDPEKGRVAQEIEQRIQEQARSTADMAQIVKAYAEENGLEYEDHDGMIIVKAKQKSHYERTFAGIDDFMPQK